MVKHPSKKQNIILLIHQWVWNDCSARSHTQLGSNIDSLFQLSDETGDISKSKIYSLSSQRVYPENMTKPFPVPSDGKEYPRTSSRPSCRSSCRPSCTDNKLVWNSSSETIYCWCQQIYLLKGTCVSICHCHCHCRNRRSVLFQPYSAQLNCVLEIN